MMAVSTERASRFRREDWWICLILVAVTLGLYAEVGGFEYIDFDDSGSAIVPEMRPGITPATLKWAFTSTENANWIPLTRLSHLLDYSFFGPWSGPPHITNVVLHILASLILFLFLRRATGSRWKSAFVAAVFAWHPLHVESVAWVAERKDVLSAAFWFLTLWLWVRYTERPTLLRYGSALAAFCMGLLSKPMLVTLPAVLILLDVWPLKRSFSARLVWEKSVFFALAATDAVITWKIQGEGGAIGSLGQYPLYLRIENSLLSYAVYVAKTVWPADLAILYPYPKQIPWWEAALCGLGLAAVIVAAVRSLRTRPWFSTGVFWFLGTLIPVIGLVQVGQQSRADRYMYVPMAGLLIVAAWGAQELISDRPRRKVWAGGVGIGICLALLPVSFAEIRLWKNTRLLFTHAIAVTRDNYVLYNNLGSYIAFSFIPEYVKGSKRMPPRPAAASLKEALGYFETARRINPEYALAWSNEGVVRKELGEIEAAANDFREALRLNPEFGDPALNLGAILANESKWNEAIPLFASAARLLPDSVEARRALGKALIETGQGGEAAETLEEASSLAPRDAEIQELLGCSLALVPGRAMDALDHFRESIRIAPRSAEAHANLGKLLLALPGHRQEAAEELRIALSLKPGDPDLDRFLRKAEASR